MKIVFFFAYVFCFLDSVEAILKFSPAQDGLNANKNHIEINGDFLMKGWTFFQTKKISNNLMIFVRNEIFFEEWLLILILIRFS